MVQWNGRDSLTMDQVNQMGNVTTNHLMKRTILSLEMQSIPVEENCEKRGLLVQSRTDNSTSILKTGIFGIDILADGIYECTANNTVDVSHIQVRVNVPGM